MKMFKDISHFSNVSDYLPILNAVLFVETVGIYLTLKQHIIHSSVLRSWYKTYGLCAVIADVSIIMIGFILARFFYNYFFSQFNIVAFVFLLVVVQIVHDVLFYGFFMSVPKGYNGMLDLFKRYGNEMGAWAILGDSVIMLTSGLLASYYANSSLNMNIIYFIITVYFLPYMLNT
jgi:hypothetical protein